MKILSLLASIIVLVIRQPKKKLVYVLGRVWELNGRFSTDTR